VNLRKKTKYSRNSTQNVHQYESQTSGFSSLGRYCRRLLRRLSVAGRSLGLVGAMISALVVPFGALLL
jgi:hypothetical protein